MSRFISLSSTSRILGMVTPPLSSWTYASWKDERGEEQAACALDSAVPRRSHIGLSVETAGRRSGRCEIVPAFLGRVDPVVGSVRAGGAWPLGGRHVSAPAPESSNSTMKAALPLAYR